MTFPRKILAVCVIGGALLSAGCGNSDSDSRAGGNPVDRAFVADMIAHHEDAVQMAQIAQRRGSSKFVKNLANDIVKTQNTEISTMRAADRRLKNAGVKAGSLGGPDHVMGMDDNPMSLKTAKPFDGAFIRMMTPHHEGAIAMAKAEIAKGKDPELKNLAHDIITAQQREIGEMRKHLREASAASKHRAETKQGDARPQAAAGRSAAPTLPSKDGRNGDSRAGGRRELPPKAQQPQKSR
jgi:uncharacterized protein (DUF305 family)